MTCDSILFFLKVKLVEGSDFRNYATKLKAMKNSSKDQPSRLVGDLLSYFFKDEYLSTHSMRGLKTVKPPLPEEIVPISGNIWEPEF